MTGSVGLEEADRRVCAALARLVTAEVPDHGDQFWPTLGRRLIAERDAPAAPTFDPRERLEQADHHHPASPSDAALLDRRDRRDRGDRGDRRERRRDRAASDTADGPVRAPPNVAQLAEHAEWIKQQGTDWSRRVVVAACVVACAVVLGAAVWVGATARHGAAPPTAGRIAALLSNRLMSAPYVLGRVDTIGFGAGTGRNVFVRSADGSFRYRRLDRRGDTAYDALTGSAQSWRIQADSSTTASADTGLAPGPPDADGADHYLLDDEIGSTIRSLEASPRVIARTTMRNGRKVWVLDLRLAASSDSRVDRMQVIVDQGRQLPVEVSRWVKGQLVHRTRFSDLRSQSAVRDDTFRLALPPSASPQPLDNGFRRSKLPDATSVVGYTPATPGWLPAGYELAAVSILPGSPTGLPATGGGDNPPDRDVTSISYRRGFDQLTVTMRRTGVPANVWKDPFLAGTAAGARVQRVRLAGGRFVGTMVEQVTAPGSPPHLWGRTDSFVFTVAGDVEPSQVLKVASSLQ